MNADQSFRTRLLAVSKLLAKIHKLILEDEIEKIELKQGKNLNPLDRLNLLLNSPDLAWLRSLSQTMAAVDEVYFQKESIAEDQLTSALKQVEALLIEPSELEFSKRYRNFLSSIPDLIIEHNLLRAALNTKA